jgi:hypothetical protein
MPHVGRGHPFVRRSVAIRNITDEFFTSMTLKPSVNIESHKRNVLTTL